MFRSQVNSADNNEMNTEHVMEWFTKHVLPYIPDNTVMVVDNTTYHNKAKGKTTNDSKQNIYISETCWASTTHPTTMTMA